MVAYKYQHWVPAVYLGYFGYEGSGRSAKLFRFDGKAYYPTTAGNECRKAWLYSKANATMAERKFANVFENDYNEIAQAVICGQELSGLQRFQLFAFMIQMNLRNCSIAIHDSVRSRFDHFTSAFDSAMTKLIPGECNDLGSALHAFHRAWDLRILYAHTGGFLTSDNPCSVYIRDGFQAPLVVLPISKKFIAVAARRGVLEFSSLGMKGDDQMQLHSGVYGQRMRFAYVDTENALTGTLDHIAPSEHRGYFSDKGFSTTFCQYQYKFTFLTDGPLWRTPNIRSAQLLEGLFH
jgi:hypothetical protein